MLDNLLHYYPATLAFIAVLLWRFISNIKQDRYRYEPYMATLTTALALIGCGLAINVFHMAHDPLSYLLVIVVSVTLAHAVYLYTINSQRLIDYMASNQILANKRQVISTAALEAIITFFAFATYMKMPTAIYTGLEQLANTFVAGNDSSMTWWIILACIAGRFFSIFIRDSYALIIFWLSFLLYFAVFSALTGGLIYSLQEQVLVQPTNNTYESLTIANIGLPHWLFAAILPYIPAIALLSLTLALKISRKFFYRNRSKEISFSTIIPYVLRTISAIVEPLILSVIAALILLHLGGLFQTN
ncbi:hypothetical protein [Psittacicella hinzii]|uniref:Uncharacterized protein n=1 Tax=Psittacicella hinzii TaxID=2028575 RepID=A0A3A1YX27_9GAMM|nr:hypothetical protein [Psittacicella hinzii]RIY40607.1 hypothetical protein CKF58_00375 [Psittacicella hinzii]